MNMQSGSTATDSSARAIRLIATHDGARQRVREIDRAITILGSGYGADVILTSSRIASAHSAIIRSGGGVCVCDLGGPCGTLVGGERIRWRRLVPGDEIEIGPFRFLVDFSERSETEASGVRGFRIVGDAAWGEATGREPLLLIGGEACCDVVLTRATAPRQALVAWTDGGPMIRDLFGRDGVLVNGAAVKEATLNHSDGLVIANERFRFEVEGSLAASTDDAASATDGKAQPTIAAWDLTPDQMVAGRVPAMAAPSLSDPSDSAGDAGSDRADRAMTETEALEILMTPSPCEAASCGTTPPEVTSELLEELSDGDEVDERPPTGAGNDHVAPRECTGDDGTERGSFEALKARIIAAQTALDKRAGHVRAELEAERRRLADYQRQLQEQARQLLETTRKLNRAANAESAPSADAAAQSSSSPRVEDASSPVNAEILRNLFAGSVDVRRCDDPAVPCGPTPPDRDESTGSPPETIGAAMDATGQAEAGSAVEADDVDTSADAAVVDAAELSRLHEQVVELTRTVRGEREQMISAESRLEAMQFEVERFRAHVLRSREKHQVQGVEQEARLEGLQRNLNTVRQEREALTARVRRLEAKEAAIRGRIDEAERARSDLDKEAERLVQMQEQYDERLRELRVNLEAERHRLRVRQTELQRKAAQLAALARNRRRSIEQLLARQEAELKEKESQIKARRTALAEAGRAELERTAAELEQLLGVRLADVESELNSRQEALDSWLRVVRDASRSVLESASPTRPTPISALPGSLMSTSAVSGVKERKTADDGVTVDDAAGRASAGRPMAVLERELQGLRRAMYRLDDETSQPFDAGRTSHSRWKSVPTSRRLATWSQAVTDRFNAKIAAIRTGIVDAENDSTMSAAAFDKALEDAAAAADGSEN